MRFQQLTVVVFAAGAALATAVACTAPDPGFVEFRERGAGVTGASSGASGTSGTSGASGGGGDGGGSSSGGGDGGGSSSGGADGGADPVFGTSAFAAGATGPSGPAKGKAQHAFGGAGNDPAGSDCQTCHAAKWGFGGTVYTNAQGAARVAGAEVRIARPDGTELAKTYSDVDGNFWIPTIGGGIPANSRVGVRNATAKKIMAGVVSGAAGGACNSTNCHNGMMRVYLN
jgi:hypothetical protein